MATSTATQSNPRAAAGWPPEAPSGENPETYRLETVERALGRTAYFSLFSVPNPDVETIPIPAKLPPPLSWLQQVPFLSNFLLAGMKVHEAPRRYVTAVELGPDNRMLARNQVGSAAGTVSIRWVPIPWNYRANPTTEPPQTILNPFMHQRFEMLDGEFRFDDGHGTGFHGFGAGRTFPAFYPGGQHLRIAAVIDVLKGFGQLAGHTGTIVVNGRITPPKQLNLNLMVRVLDPSGNFLTHEPLPPFPPEADPDPTATFMMFLGEVDPQSPSTLRTGPDGSIVGLNLRERLRLIDLDFVVEPARGLKSRVVPGPVVGEASSTVHFAPADPHVPIPFQTTDGVLKFFGRDGAEVGTVHADLIEGRGFPTPLDGVPAPFFRIGGFGPIAGGSGQFLRAEGMLSVNGALSLFPRTFSNLYVLRFIDAHQKLRVKLRQAGA